MCCFEFVSSSSKHNVNKIPGKLTATTVFYEKLESGRLKEVTNQSSQQMLLTSTVQAQRIEQALKEEASADTVKEYTIPEQYIGELIEITQRSRKPSEHDDDKPDKDWPQYLTEEELQEMMRLM